MSITNEVMVQLTDDERRRLNRIATMTGERPEHLLQRVVCDVFTDALDRAERIARARRAAEAGRG